MTKGLPDLRRVTRGLANNEVLVPAIHTALLNPKFKAFNVPIEEWIPRPPDGYFHPSTHSTWNVRQLALYLMKPELIEEERMTAKSIFAITQGHFWHMFIQEVLKPTGYLLDAEIPFKDEEHKRTGHMDGLLRIKGENEGLEIKTINQFKIGKMKSVNDLIEQKFQYYAQAQEYMDVFYLPRMRFLFISPSYPFPMQEFVVKANPKHQERRREIYKGAIEIAGSGQYPLPQIGCCEQNECAVMRACKGIG